MFINWVLSAPAEHGGIIVQHIRLMKRKVYHCDGRPTRSAEAPYYNYWEAWSIAPGAVSPPVAIYGKARYSDVWAIMGRSPKGTRGSLRIAGTARFYPATALPVGFNVHPRRPAGGLPATRRNPHLRGAIGLPVLRIIDISWNCCCQKNGPTHASQKTEIQ